MKTKIILQATMCAAVLGLASSTYAQVTLPKPGNGIPVSPIEGLFATGTGDVTVSATFVSDSAADDDQLFLYDVKGGGTVTLAGSLQLGGNGPFIFDNHSSSTGSSVDLGTFSAGDELVFELKDLHTGKDWFSGSDTGLNVDGKNHFDVSSVSGNTTTVGVEDATDFDYNDLVFSFSGVSGQTVTVPDAAGTMSLLGLGLTGLMAVGRRFRK